MNKDERLAWRAGLSEFDAYNVQALLAIFALWGVPRSYLDVGCGTGVMVRTARALGVNALGIDQLEGEYTRVADLCQPIDLERQFDLVTCIEVAEHLPESVADTLCQTLIRHVAPRGKLVFTAAPVGQEGYGHKNMQSAFWWRSKMYAYASERGLDYRRDRTVELQLLWTYCTGNLMHLPSSLQVFA